MDRPVILLQFILVLVVAITVISACECGKKLTVEKAFCNGRTLIMATAKRMEHVDAQYRPVTKEDDAYWNIYYMQLKVIYHERRKLLRENDTFGLVTAKKAEDCGVEFELDTDYNIAGQPMKGRGLGETLHGTFLAVDSCDYVEKTPEENELKNDLLTLQTQVNCSEICKVVPTFGATLTCE